MFELLTEYKRAELAPPLPFTTVSEISERSQFMFGCELPNEYRMFLYEFNGFYCNGYSIFGCYDDEAIEKDHNLQGMDYLRFNDSFRDYSDVEDYLILGKSSLDYIAYEIETEQFVVVTNGTLDDLYRSDSFIEALKHFLEYL